MRNASPRAWLVAVLLPCAASAAGDENAKVAEITVTATRIERLAFDVASATTVVTHEEVHEKNPSVMTDLLRGEAGVYVQSTTSGQGSPILRGLTGSSILTLVDGMRLNNSIFRPAPNQYFGLVDAYNIDRIEVVRGAGSTLHGSDAMGGVVNVLTPTYRFDSDEWQWHGRTLTQFASADLSGIGRLSLNGGRRGLSFSGGATYQHHDDLHGGGGEQEHSDYEMVAGDGKILWEGEAHDVLMSTQYLVQPDTPRHDALVAGYGQDTPESAVFAFEPNDRLFVHGRYRNYSVPYVDELVLHLAFQEINDDRRSRDYGITSEDRERNRSRMVGITLQGKSEIEPATFTYGTDIYLDHIDSRRKARDIVTEVETERTSRFPDGSDLDSFGFFGEAEWHLHRRLDATLGLRVSHFVIDIPSVTGSTPVVGEAVDRDITDVTGSIGLSYELTPQIRLVSNAGRGFRVPNVFDFATFGSRPGDRFALPNPDLDPETAWSFDAGTKVRSSLLDGELIAFFQRVDDRIEAVDTGEFTETGRRIVRNENVSRVDFVGVEIAARLRPRDDVEVHWTLNYTWGEETQDGSSSPADRIPPVNGEIGVRYRPRSEVWIEPAVRYAGSQNRLSAQDESDPRIDPDGTDAFWVAILRAGWQVHDHLGLRFTLENPIDNEYREHGSGMDGPGINAILALEGDW